MKFIIFEGEIATTTIFWKDLDNYENVKIINKDKSFKSKILSFFFRIHMSQRINRTIVIPLKTIWFKYLMNYYSIKEDEICFIFIAGWFSKELHSWIRKQYPKGKQVLFLRDTINSYERTIPDMKGGDLNIIFDLVISYNKVDADNFGFILSSVFLSRLDMSMLPVFSKSDLVFIGVAKDRLSIIHGIFVKAYKAGLKCDFYITGVDEGNQLYSDNINYGKAQIPYLEYLGRQTSSKCILEVVKGDTAGNTLRCWEAVYYNKKLLTNWSGIKDFKFYNPKFMRYFSSVEDIDIDFIKNDYPVDYHYDNENSPTHLLSLIEEKLSNEN